MTGSSIRLDKTLPALIVYAFFLEALPWIAPAALAGDAITHPEATLTADTVICPPGTPDSLFSPSSLNA